MKCFLLKLRAKQEVQERKRLVAKQQAELEHMLLRARKKAMREAREKKLYMLEAMPASMHLTLMEVNINIIGYQREPFILLKVCKFKLF